MIRASAVPILHDAESWSSCRRKGCEVMDSRLTGNITYFKSGE